ELNKSPAQIIKERIKELQSKARPNQIPLQHNQPLTNPMNPHTIQMNQTKNNSDPWAALKSHPKWQQSSFMRKPTNNKNGPIIDPFNKKKTKNTNQNPTTIDPFSKIKK